MTQTTTAAPDRTALSGLGSSLRRKRLVGVLLFALIFTLFFSFNRFPKLDTVEDDLAAATASESECFQGFCLEENAETPLLERWWEFSVTYLWLVTTGMFFAFLAGGITETFFFPEGSGARLATRRGWRGSLQGLIFGPVMTLCSACIVPVSESFRRRGAGIETTVAMTQGSSTLNIPALFMIVFIFSPLLAGSRLALSIAGVLLLGPIVAWVSDGRSAPPGSNRGAADPPGIGAEETGELRGARVGPGPEPGGASVAVASRRSPAVPAWVRSMVAHVLAVFMLAWILGLALSVRSRVTLSLVAAALVVPVVLAARGRSPVPGSDPERQEGSRDVEPWVQILRVGVPEWFRSATSYALRLGPIMIAAAFISGLAIQWFTPDTVSDYLGNDLRGVLIAAAIGTLINVPLLAEIPLVAVLILFGMGEAPAATLLFTAAAPGPITFWGLSKVIPLDGVVSYAVSVWAMGVIGGLAVMIVA